MQSNEASSSAGIDREGDLWTITVHGPGKVIVTDTTPNDGALDDDINTIQLVGTNPKKTYVTGLVAGLAEDAGHRPARSTWRLPPRRTGSAVLPSGTVMFNQLIATSGVKSIELNGLHPLEPGLARGELTDGRLPLRRRENALVPGHPGTRFDTTTNSTPAPDRHRYAQPPLEGRALDLPQ